jgi:D-alanine transaminase
MLKFKTVYLNGKFLPAETATVSVFDRGFIFGDGIYEYIPVFGRRLFRFTQHLARLDNSLSQVRIVNPLSASEWREMAEKLIAEIPADDQSIYIHISRGVAPRDHAFPGRDTRPTVLAYAQPITYPTPEQVQHGVAAITARDNRWERCDIKAISLLPNVLLRQEAVDAGAAETILLRDGHMTEGAACNVFVVAGDCVVTPPNGPAILPGITRDLTLELMRAHGVLCDERPVSETELRGAQEIWLTSSSREILPVTRLDGNVVGTGKPGSLHARVFAMYRDYKRDVIAGKVD